MSTPGAPTFGILYEPATQPAAAVICCNPLFEERKSAHRPLVAFARNLSRNNLSVLRFDYRGCGDAGGNFEDYNLAHWQHDLQTATELLKQRYPGLPLGLFALRFGSAVALSAIKDDLIAPDFLLMWQPVLHGDAYIEEELRKKMMQQMLTFGRARETRSTLFQQLERGETVDHGGYPFTSSLYGKLKGVELSNTLKQTNCPALIYNISAGGRLEKPYADLQEAAAQKDSVLHVEAVKHQPFWNLIGYVDISRLLTSTVDWLQRHALPAQSPTDQNENHANPPHRHGEAPLGNLRLSPEEEWLCTPNNGINIHGILHYPPSGCRHPDRAIIFLPGWSGDRVGPHRMFVKCARRLASSGVLCLRFDYRGRGDSEGTTKEAGIASMTDDARSAAQFLRSKWGVSSIYLLGICSGGKVAISASTAEQVDAAGLVIWSGEAMGRLRTQKEAARTKSRRAAKTYLKKLFHPATWRKLFSGKVDRKAVNKALFHPEQPDEQEVRDEDQHLERFKQFRGRICFIYGGNDPDTSKAAANYQSFCRKHRIPHTFHKIPEANHSFYGLDWEKTVIDTTAQWMEEDRGDQQIRADYSA